MQPANKFSSPAATPDPVKSHFWSETFSVIRTLAILLIIALSLRASVVEAFKIPSSSMEPTLEIGDQIFVNKLSYGFRPPLFPKPIVRWSIPQRGDIVVFTLPDDPKTTDRDESDTNLIKRVMGLPGDTIEVRGTQVFINDAVYANDSRYARWLSGGQHNFGPVTVPAGRVLMLGDNRDFSKDSRFWDDPFLDIDRIKGRAFIIYWNSLFSFKRIFTILR
jgi:signal peptidase I